MAADRRKVRAKSARLVKRMQREKSIERRMPIVEEMLELEYGVWNSEDQRNPETLKGFLKRVGEGVVDGAHAYHGPRANILDADDISQEVFVTFVYKVHTIKKSVRGWLIGVACRIVRKKMREGRAYKSRSLEEIPRGQQPTIEPHADAKTDQGASEAKTPVVDPHRKQLLRQALDQLTPPLKRVMQGVRKGKTLRAIAESTGLKTNTVVIYRKRGTQAMRAYVSAKNASAGTAPTTKPRRRRKRGRENRE